MFTFVCMHVFCLYIVKFMDLSDLLSAFFVSKPMERKSKKNLVTSVCTQTETKEESDNCLDAKEEHVQEHEQHQHQSGSSGPSSDSSGQSSASSTSASTVKEQREVVETFSDNVEFNVKKLILKGVDLKNKSICIANTDMADGVTVLSEIIDSLSLIKGVEEMYSKSVYVVTSSENRSIFKKMLLDNPYMYFTDFTVKGTLTNKKLEEISEDSKKTIVVVDMNVKMDLKRLMNGSVQLFIMGANSDAVDFYRSMGEAKMIFYKREKLKSLQKRFFNTFVKRICETDVGFEDFYKYFNQDVFGIKYILIKGQDLRYY